VERRNSRRLWHEPVLTKVTARSAFFFFRRSLVGDYDADALASVNIYDRYSVRSTPLVPQCARRI